MSGGGPKNDIERIAQMDSRAIAQFGRTLHWQGLVDEAKHNEANPGRAITKAGINAALWYLGGEAGSALNGSGGAADAAGGAAADAAGGYTDAGSALDLANQATPYVSDAAGAAGSLAGGGSQVTAQQLGQAATQDSLNSGLFGAGAQPSSLQMSQMTQPGGILGQAAPVTDNSVQAQNSLLRGIQDRAAMAYGRGRDALSGAMNLNQAPVAAQQDGAPVYDQSVNARNAAFANAQDRMAMGLAPKSGNGGKNLAMQMGVKMMSPTQPRQMPEGRPAPQGQQGPLNNPYQNSLTMNNSMGLTEDQKQRLRAMGYQV
jgi:hypothetical protein